MTHALIFAAGFLVGTCLCAVIAVVAMSRGAKELQEWDRRNGKHDVTQWKADPILWRYRREKAERLRTARVRE